MVGVLNRLPVEEQIEINEVEQRAALWMRRRVGLGLGFPEQNRDKRRGVQDHFGRPCSS
jgi:hypothetical protein